MHCHVPRTPWPENGQSVGTQADVPNGRFFALERSRGQTLACCVV